MGNNHCRAPAPLEANSQTPRGGRSGKEPRDLLRKTQRWRQLPAAAHGRPCRRAFWCRSEDGRSRRRSRVRGGDSGRRRRGQWSPVLVETEKGRGGSRAPTAAMLDPVLPESRLLACPSAPTFSNPAKHLASGFLCPEGASSAHLTQRDSSDFNLRGETSTV